MALQTHFEAYLLTQRRVARNTFCAYQRDLNQFKTYLDSIDACLETAHEQNVKDFLAHLKDHHACTARSMARKISALKLFYAYAHENHALPNIMQEFSAPKIEKKLPNFLTEQELELLLVTADADTTELGYRNKVILYLLYVSGIRISELTLCKVNDIYFDTGFMRVEGKGGKQRMIPLPEYMMTMLREYTSKKAESSDLMLKESEYLFPVLYGGKAKPITRQACWIILKGLCKKAGIKRSISPHTMRHSLATHMLKNGTDLRSLQLILGHENVTTVQVYTHVEVTHLREIYNKKHPRS